MTEEVVPDVHELCAVSCFVLEQAISAAESQALCVASASTGGSSSVAAIWRPFSPGTSRTTTPTAFLKGSATCRVTLRRD